MSLLTNIKRRVGISGEIRMRITNHPPKKKKKWVKKASDDNQVDGALRVSIRVPNDS